ncbi:MAG: hypothetical protein J6O13_08650, partial [Selenomonas sp.]|nr:hypothetical protein [Selenomonas sp.]
FGLFLDLLFWSHRISQYDAQRNHFKGASYLYDACLTLFNFQDPMRFSQNAVATVQSHASHRSRWATLI